MHLSGTVPQAASTQLGTPPCRARHPLCCPPPVGPLAARQEPDTAASAAQALVSLVAREERYFPLGFAYGHLRDAAVSVFDLAGRG